jgi:hypothetical protein
LPRSQITSSTFSCLRPRINQFEPLVYFILAMVHRPSGTLCCQFLVHALPLYFRIAQLTFVFSNWIEEGGYRGTGTELQYDNMGCRAPKYTGYGLYVDPCE